jgi:hypothetical protein
MQLPPDARITTEILWKGALLFALLDLPFVAILVWRIRPSLFIHIKWELIIVTALFWWSLWYIVIRNFWETVYRYVFPDWAHWYLPFFQAILAALVALAVWWVARHSRTYPVLAYLLLGGLWGAISHLWAVHLGIVTKPPMLQGAQPFAAVVIAFFEFVFYWCIIMTAAALLHSLHQWLNSRQKISPNG